MYQLGLKFMLKPSFNRTVKGWNRLTETRVSAATVDILKSRLGRRFQFHNWWIRFGTCISTHYIDDDLTVFAICHIAIDMVVKKYIAYFWLYNIINLCVRACVCPCTHNVDTHVSFHKRTPASAFVKRNKINEHISTHARTGQWKSSSKTKSSRWIQ